MPEPTPGIAEAPGDNPPALLKAAEDLVRTAGRNGTYSEVWTIGDSRMRALREAVDAAKAKPEGGS